MKYILPYDIEVDHIGVVVCISHPECEWMIYDDIKSMVIGCLKKMDWSGKAYWDYNPVILSTYLYLTSCDSVDIIGEVD